MPKADQIPGNIEPPCTENICHSHHHAPIYPYKSSSRQVSPTVSDGPQPSSSTRRQEKLKSTMEKEIWNQTFSFPPQELARMLSPKIPKPDTDTAGKLLQLDDCKCTVDEQPFLHALNDVVARIDTFDPQPPGSAESASYPGLVKFLMDCVKACHKALDRQPGLPPRQERWYEKLEFTVARKVGDRVDHASPLWPDITGGKGISAFRGEQLYWRPPREKPNHRITLPVELKNNWRDMVSQAATYARSLFSANPMRIFALVLAFNQEQSTLRFLVFHRSGLTTSEECNITKEDGLKEVAHLFLTLTCWRTAEDAGFITCYSHSAYLLPRDQDGTNHVSAEVERILFWHHCIRGRMTLVSRLRLSSDTPQDATNLPRIVPKPLMELTQRRSTRLLKKAPASSNPARSSSYTGHSRGHESRGLPPVGYTTAPREEGEQADGRFFLQADHLGTS